MYRIKVDKKDNASLTPTVVMYSQLQICTKAHAEGLLVEHLFTQPRTWLFCHTNSLEIDQKWPFSPFEIDLISLLLSVEKSAFYMWRSCKLDLSTPGYYKT